MVVNCFTASFSQIAWKNMDFNCRLLSVKKQYGISKFIVQSLENTAANLAAAVFVVGLAVVSSEYLFVITRMNWCLVSFFNNGPAM